MAMEFVRVGYEKDTQAIIIELVVPNVEILENLSRIELLISHDNNEPTFGMMLNVGDRLDPIPPGNFGVIIAPASDDRSIKNVSSAVGLPGRFDHLSPRGNLLKQSASGVVNANLGMSIWIAPQDWTPGNYTIKTRAVQWKHLPTSWQQLATFNYSEKNVSQLKHNSAYGQPPSGFYGKSIFFEVKAEDEIVEVQIPLYPAS